MNRSLGQTGFGKVVIVLALCLVIAGCYYFFGYRKDHTPAAIAHKAAVAKQAAKVNHAQQLETKLVTAWKQTLTSTPPDGNVDVAVYDNGTGATAHYTNATTASGGTFITASIIKMSILETLLWQNQQSGIETMTSGQLAEATPMIENSDNDAATDLWQMDGGQDAINRFFQKIDASSSTANVDWGLTTTTALDQLKVVNEVAYPGKLLTTSSANQADDLMDHVEADQQWGVSGGVPAGVTVQLKNGWLQDADVNGTDGWNINSIGHVHGNGTDYTIAVLTNDNQTMQDGINTIQALATDAWNAVSTASN
jgi:beta-lactamase class A